ncbi:MAG: hypothetical protein WA957_15700 [Alteraurantiacibacter sp.]
MTHYLGIITAYGAVAVMAWLAAMLYPRLIPASAAMDYKSRWRQAGFFLVAVAASFAIAGMNRRGLLLSAGSLAAGLAMQLIASLPLLAFIAIQRNRSAILVPQKSNLRSLAIGVGVAVLAVAAYFLSTGRWEGLPLLAQTASSGEAITIALRTVLRCVLVAAFLALVADGWSIRAALGIASLAIAATQVPSLLADGFTIGWLGMLVMHVALVTGLLSAIYVTRNIVWFWPVFFALNLLQFATA